MAYFGNTTSLPANGIYTSDVKLADRADNISGAVFSDQPGTIFIEQSGDGTNWDISSNYPVTANNGSGFSESLLLPYVRLRYVNGANAQGTFRITGRFTSAGDS